MGSASPEYAYAKVCEEKSSSILPLLQGVNSAPYLNLNATPTAVLFTSNPTILEFKSATVVEMEGFERAFDCVVLELNYYFV